MSRRVVILQETLPQYRVAFFTEIRRQAAAHGITVHVLHGRASAMRGARLSTGKLPEALKIENHYLTIPGSKNTLVWQAALGRCLRSDLVVVEQANRLLINYVLLAAQRLRGPRVAFWGHGRNHQAPRLTHTERLKARIATLPWWWFPYTSGVADYLMQQGFPSARMSIVGNTIDVASLREEIAHVRKARSLTPPARCIFIGGLYKEKRLDVLFDAADRIVQAIPEFELCIAGEGELRPAVERFTVSRPWAHYFGNVEGQRRASLLATAQLLLMPGLVGLVVLDSFAAGVPLVTMADSLHSPEIEYLKHGLNGWIAAKGAGPEEYAIDVIRLLQDKASRDKLSSGASSSADRHTLEDAAARFTDGLRAALRAKVRTRS